MADVRAWNKLISKTVVFACKDRSFFAITEEPRGWSIGLDLGETREWIFDKKTYKSVYVSEVTRSTLEEIAESEDFERGFLRLAFLPKEKEAALADLMPYQRARADVDIELLRRDGDGQIIEWSNPSRTREELGQKLVPLLESAGWQILK